MADVAPTYRDILADPDNIDLNLRFADAQIASGNLEGAAATLERLLMIEPRLDNVRLLRARVLRQIGDLAQAQREVALLLTRPLAQDQRQEAENLAGVLNGAGDGYDARAFVQLGVGYETNSGFASSAQSLLLNDALSINPKDETGDVGLFMAAGGDLSLPLGMGNGDHRFVFSGLAQGRIAQEAAERGAMRLAAGPRIDLGAAILDLRALVGFDAAGSDYARWSYGGEGALEVRLTRITSAFLVASLVNEVVDSPLSFGAPVDRDGLYGQVRGGLTFRPSVSTRYVLAARWRQKEADDAFESYRGYGLEGQVSFGFAHGQRIEAGLVGERVLYDAPNPTISLTRERADTRLDARLAYAIPMASLSEALGGGPVGEGFEVQLYAGHTRWLSSIDNYDAANTYAGLAITRRFGSWRRQ